MKDLIFNWLLWCIVGVLWCRRAVMWTIYRTFRINGPICVNNTDLEIHRIYIYRRYYEHIGVLTICTDGDIVRHPIGSVYSHPIVYGDKVIKGTEEYNLFIRYEQLVKQGNKVL